MRWTWILILILCLGATAVADDAPVADAAEQQNAKSLAVLLAKKVNPNVAQVDGMTALLWAAHHDDLTTARRLVEAGADVKATNRYGVGALSLACKNGNGELVKLLLAKGADSNAALRGGETALMTASRTGRLSAVAALIENGAKVDAKERRGQTALMWAAAEGHVDVVDALIKAGADFKKPIGSGFTPLMFAVRDGQIVMAEYLIKKGVNVNEAMTRARGGRTGPVKNTTPLLMAMENAHFELAAMLLKAGADPNDARTGFTPLQSMCWIRKPDIGDGGSGTPPPTVSGKLSSLEFVRKLVVAGAKVDLEKAKNGGGRRKISVQGMTAFLCAASTADVPLMKTLLDLGADSKARNAKGQTALMYAAGVDESPEGDGPATHAEHVVAVKFLLDRGADINATDRNGETAMHGGAYRMAPSVVQLLVARGADIKVWAKKSKQGRTPLLIAQGFRPGNNFKPSADTIAAIEKAMLAKGVTPPPPPKRRDQKWRK
jgi:ankyrin repeat protein